MTKQPALVVGIALGLVASACSGVGGPWSPTPTAPLDSRGFAATACNEGQMLVWGGSQPSGMPQNELMSGAAIFDTEGLRWTSIEDPSIELRERAGAVYANDRYVVWGGSDGLTTAEDPSEFVYFANGSSYSPKDESWDVIPPSALEPRSQPQLEATQNGVLVLWGNSPPGVPRPARGVGFYDVMSSTWEMIAEPDIGSVAVELETILAFGPTRVTEYDSSTDSWVERARSAAELTRPDTVIALSKQEALVFQGTRAWIFDTVLLAFTELPPVPVSTVTYVGPSDGGVVVWDETSPAVASFDIESGAWIDYEIARRLTPREGTSACTGPTTLTVWGGWRIGETFRTAEDTGFVLELDSASQE